MLHLTDISFKKTRDEFSVIIDWPMGKNDHVTVSADANTVYVEAWYANHESNRHGKSYVREEQKGSFDLTIPLPVAVDQTEGHARIFKEKLYVWFPYAEKVQAGREKIHIK